MGRVTVYWFCFASPWCYWVLVWEQYVVHYQSLFNSKQYDVNAKFCIGLYVDFVDCFATLPLVFTVSGNS